MVCQCLLSLNYHIILQTHQISSLKWQASSVNFEWLGIVCVVVYAQKNQVIQKLGGIALPVDPPFCLPSLLSLYLSPSLLSLSLSLISLPLSYLSLSLISLPLSYLSPSLLSLPLSYLSLSLISLPLSYLSLSLISPSHTHREGDPGPDEEADWRRRDIGGGRA